MVSRTSPGTVRPFQLVSGMCLGEAGPDVGPVVILELPGVVEMERPPVRLGGVVPVVEVGGGLVDPEPPVIRRKRVVDPVEDRLPVPRLDPKGAGVPVDGSTKVQTVEGGTPSMSG